MSDFSLHWIPCSVSLATSRTILAVLQDVFFDIDLDSPSLKEI